LASVGGATLWLSLFVLRMRILQVARPASRVMTLPAFIANGLMPIRRAVMTTPHDSGQDRDATGESNLTTDCEFRRIVEKEVVVCKTCTHLEES